MLILGEDNNNLIIVTMDIRNHVNLIKNHGYKGKIGILKSDINGLIGIPCAKQDQIVLYQPHLLHRADDKQTIKWNKTHCTIEFPYSEEEIQKRRANNNGIATHGTCVGVPLNLIEEIII
jgi:hypothetical protein